MTPKEIITVEKEVYEAVLRNSVRVNDLEAENEQMKLIIKRTKASGNYPGRVSAYKARIINLSEENQQLKELLKECRDMINNHCSWQVMDRPNHYIKKIENDIYEPLLTKIDEVLK